MIGISKEYELDHYKPVNKDTKINIEGFCNLVSNLSL